jgi:hypothetical protein
MDTFTAMNFDANDVSSLLQMLAAVLLVGDTEFVLGANVRPACPRDRLCVLLRTRLVSSVATLRCSSLSRPVVFHSAEVF